MRFFQLGMFALGTLVTIVLVAFLVAPAEAGKKGTGSATDTTTPAPKKGKKSAVPGAFTSLTAQHGQALDGKAKWKDQGKQVAVVINVQHARQGVRLQGAAYPRPDCKGRLLTTVDGDRVEAKGSSKLKLKVNQRLAAVGSVGLLDGRDNLLACSNYSP